MADSLSSACNHGDSSCESVASFMSAKLLSLLAKLLLCLFFDENQIGAIG
jgi:hypothetical protein